MIIHEVEQNTPEWLLLRAGIPTASAFSNLVTSTGKESASLEKYAYTLAANKYANGEIDSFEGNYHTERGHELEAAAISAYEFVNDAKVDRVGFVTTDSEEYGCSPDGLVDDEGMVEIKCLKAETHIETILYFKKHGTFPPKYYQQVQGQMMICGRTWCDLVFYHPTLPLLVIQSTPDKEFCDSLAIAIKSVIVRRDEIIEIMENL